MFEPMEEVRVLAPTARLDTCPYDGDSNKTAYFIRIGPNGHWLSNARKSPRAAWHNAAHRLRHEPTDETHAPRLPILESPEAP
jgi:hypothetical protein